RQQQPNSGINLVLLSCLLSPSSLQIEISPKATLAQPKAARARRARPLTRFTHLAAFAARLARQSHPIIGHWPCPRRRERFVASHMPLACAIGRAAHSLLSHHSHSPVSFWFFALSLGPCALIACVCVTFP